MNNILTPATAESILHDQLCSLDHEECWALFLSCGNALLATKMLSMGTLTSTAIDVRTILRQALLCNAKSIILMHNHLSGNPLPSVQDIRLTQQLRSACNLMEVNLIDHIIITDKSFYSFAEERTITL